jgi:DNA-binding transcriptional regulator LsrR (DeoR family)
VTKPPLDAGGELPDRPQRRLDLAARAGWLYYIGDKTQDEIARRLGVSRQGAQRLVALAKSAGLIKFRMDHRVADCAALAERLQQRYGLASCEVVPSAGAGIAAVAVSAAEQVEARLAQRAPAVIALGSGRTLRATVQQVASLERPMHIIVSLVGNLTREGRASQYEVVMRLADVAGAQCHPMPLPVVADSIEEAAQMRARPSYRVLHDLVRRADIHFVGVGDIGPGAPLHQDGFISDAELDELLRLGAVGEICGWALDAGGRLIEGGTNRRMMAIPLTDPPAPTRVGIAAGAAKVAPIRAALEGGLLAGLVTDEPTATAVLGA